ncbi:MAG: hypothetical protein R3C24_16690 [Cyanobacteriota/Melainabacteria group bacterium]
MYACRNCATKHGVKELLTIVDGYRESEQSWLEALNDLSWRGLTKAPKSGRRRERQILSTSSGIWRYSLATLLDGQTGNVLDKLPKSIQAQPSYKLASDLDGGNKGDG